MSSNKEKQRGIAPDPAETGRDIQQPQKEAKEGDYRNAETTGNASFFDDEYESLQEDQLGREEAKTEDRGSSGKT